MSRSRSHRAAPPVLRVDSDTLFAGSSVRIVLTGVRRGRLRHEIGAALVRLGVRVMGMRLKAFKVQNEQRVRRGVSRRLRLFTRG